MSALFLYLVFPIWVLQQAEATMFDHFGVSLAKFGNSFQTLQGTHFRLLLQDVLDIG
jgi:hypothetical protein